MSNFAYNLEKLGFFVDFYKLFNTVVTIKNVKRLPCKDLTSFLTKLG